jgi:hypothetical protein
MLKKNPDTQKIKNNIYMRNLFLFILGFLVCYFVFFLFKKESKENKSPDNLKRSQLESNLIKAGNIKDYTSLKTLYISEGLYKFLPYAYLIANKYHYKEAYMDVYISLFDLGCKQCSDEEKDLWSLKNLDPDFQRMAKIYLQIAADSNIQQAKEIIQIYKKTPSEINN